MDGWPGWAGALGCQQARAPATSRHESGHPCTSRAPAALRKHAGRCRARGAHAAGPAGRGRPAEQPLGGGHGAAAGGARVRVRVPWRRQRVQRDLQLAHARAPPAHHALVILGRSQRHHVVAQLLVRQRAGRGRPQGGRSRARRARELVQGAAAPPRGGRRRRRRRRRCGRRRRRLRCRRRGRLRARPACSPSPAPVQTGRAAAVGASALRPVTGRKKSSPDEQVMRGSRSPLHGGVASPAAPRPPSIVPRHSWGRCVPEKQAPLHTGTVCTGLHCVANARRPHGRSRSKEATCQPERLRHGPRLADA